MHLPSSGQRNRHQCGLIRLSLQYPLSSFDDPSHHLSLHSLCLSFMRAHAHACTLQIPFLFLPLSSSFISSSHITCLFLTFLYLSLPSCSTSSSPLSAFEVCHTFCFVRCYTVISNSAIFPLGAV